MKDSGTRFAITATFLVIAIGLAIPVLSYLHRFGTSISDSHQRWSEFGSYIGGIYTPILALLTLSVIAAQLLSQVNFNKHQIDQAFLANSRSDLDYYLAQLDKILQKSEHISQSSLKDSLIAMFSRKSKADLESPICQKDVKRIELTDSRLPGIWGGVYTIFLGLDAAKDDQNYELVLKGSTYKCLAVLGADLCEALDNYHFAAYKIRDFKYRFSSIQEDER